MISIGIFMPPSSNHCNSRKDTFGPKELLLPAPSVTFAVTIDAKRQQVVHHIAPELAPGFPMMYLQIFHGTALLTPPTIPLQHSLSKQNVIFGI